MKEAIDKLNDFYCLDIEMNEITSKTTEKNRKIRLNNFAKSDKIYLMFSVRILDECIDIPACDSIFITYPSKSKIRTIQRLSRCIRIDKNNKFKIGNIFIWCDEYSEILETLSGIKEYDIFFKDKIKVNEIGFYKRELKDDLEKDNKLVKDYIMGIKEFKYISWDDKLELVKKYIDENHKRPNRRDINATIGQMGIWIVNQQKNYKKKDKIMKHSSIYDKWTNFIEEYKEYFMSNEEGWYNNLEQVKKYIDENHKRPSSRDNNKEIKKLGNWLSNQQNNYIDKKQIMKNNSIYLKWTEFISDIKYKIYFMTNIEIWYINFKKIKLYIDEYNKRPSKHSNNNNIKKLGYWISDNIKYYKNKKQIMKFEEIYNKWTQFINNPTYMIFFNTSLNEKIKKNENIIINNKNINIWCNNLKQLKEYITKNKKRPSSESIDKVIKSIGKWSIRQKINYNSKINIMKNQEIYDKWTDFINDPLYKDYFD
jgi:hypothetical protein